jgi:hypothetical protein
MTNIIFTGLIRTEDRFKKSISDFIELRKDNLVNQIIFSTWIGQLDKYDTLREFLEENKIQIVESNSPSICKGSFLQQSKSLHCGLDAIKDKSLMIFKTRTDLYIQKKALIDIFKMDLNLDKNISFVFEKKIWLPWFEITKPFYLADECFLAAYNDAKKLVNYNMIYDSYYDIDSGLSHIRRFIDPFRASFPIFNTYLQYLATTAHGTNLRFEVLKEFKKNEDYLNFLFLYYYVVKNYFYIGFDDGKNYITFRQWSDINIKLPNSLEESFSQKYTLNKDLGHIYSNSHKWIDNILKQDKIKFQFDVNIEKLGKLHKFALDSKNKAPKKNKLFVILIRITNALKIH